MSSVPPSRTSTSSSTSSTTSLYSPSASSASAPSSSPSAYLASSHTMETPSVQHRPMAAVQVILLTCLRCQRSVELTSTDDLSSNGIVQIGVNIYYCMSCAKTTGYI